MIDQFTWIELNSDGGVTHMSGMDRARFGRSVMDEDQVECGVGGGWIWDKKSLVVESDSYGYLPLYVHHTADRIIVSDSPLSILQRIDRPETDPIALGFLCRAGFLLGDRTLFQGIRRVPAGTRMTWTDGVLESETLESPTCDGPNSIREAVDGWADRFQVAMSRRLFDSGTFDLPLSGGRDSRMILLELHRQGVVPRRILSLGSDVSRGSSDAYLASSLARRLDLPFMSVRRHDRDWLEAERARHVACGYEALEHVWLMPLWNELLDGGAPWYDGLGAGSLTRNSAASLEMTGFLRDGDLALWAERFFTLTAATSPRWLDPILARAPFTIGNLDVVQEDLEKELSRHRDAPNPTTSFTFDNWGRRSIALNPLGICRSRRTIELPFMDRDLVAWARSIPLDMAQCNDIQTEACHRLYPEFSDLPFDDGAPQKASKASLWRRYRRKLQKKRFFKENTRYFGTLPFEALGDSRDRAGSHRALVLMFHLACVDTLLTGRAADSSTSLS